MILQYFSDWQKKTGDVYEKSTTIDSQGRPVDGETLLQSGVQFATWIDRAIQTNTSDQFNNDEIGTILFDPALIDFTPNNNMVVKVGAEIYYIEGVHDVASFGEVWQLTYRKERK